MPVHEFFLRYANEPLSVRARPVDPEKYHSLSLIDIYREVKKIEDRIRPRITRRDLLLKVARDYWKREAEQNV